MLEAPPRPASSPVAPLAYRWFRSGDWNAFFALLLDNMINLVVFASILAGGFGFPAEVIQRGMIPGTALGVLAGDVVYTLLALRLARKLGRDVTAMPLGLDTPSTIGIALAVLGPAFLAQKADLAALGLAPAEAARRAAEGAWAVGMAVMLVMGAVKVAFSFFGEWVRKRVPTAGLLGSIGGIGLLLLSFFPLLDIFKAPVVGMAALGLVLTVLVARIDLPWRLPGAVAAVGLGTVLYYVLGPLGLLGAATFHAPELSLHLSLPVPTLAGLRALPQALPYLPIAIPFGLLTIVGGINVTESARAAGDTYATRDILLTEAVATLLAGLFGGVAQSTPYIGHPAYKAMGARAGYTLATGLAVGLGGALGYVSFVTQALPLAAVVPLLLFVGLEITQQAFHASPPRHAPAVAFAFLPLVAYLLLIRQEATLGALRAAGGEALLAQVSARIDAPILAGLAHGFILTAMLWGSFFALLIDRALRRAAGFIALTGVLTLFGVVHSAGPSGELYLPWAAPSRMPLHWAAGYFTLAGLVLLLSATAAARAPEAHEPRAEPRTSP